MADANKLFYTFPPERQVSDKEYDDQIKAFIQKLDKISAKEYTKGAGTDKSLLNLLNPSVQTLPYLKVLLSHISPNEKPKSHDALPAELRPDGAIWAKLVEFLAVLDPVQMRYVGKEWRRLVLFVNRVAVGFDMPVIAIHPIRSAMLRLDPEGGVLTSTHLLFLRLCLHCQTYAEALPVLENIIHSFPAKSSSSVDAPYPCSNHAVSSGFLTEKLGFTDLSTSAEIQEYFLLGGMCYIALQRWEDAQIFLEHVLVTPTQGVPTGMMLEAYRKWLLVGCLASGQAPKPPKLINQTALKDMRATSPHYISLSEVFVSANPTRLAGEMYEGVTHWSEDGNTGLVQQLPDYLRRFYVATLEKTYSAIPVTAVAGWLCQPPDEAQQYLEDLIQEGHLNARIEPSSNGSQWPILRFFTDPSTGPRVKSEADQLLNVQRQAQRTNLLAEYVRDADRKLAITKEYIQKLMSKDSEKRAAEALASQGVFDPAVMDMMDTSAAMGGIGDGEDDEDLMEEFH